MPTYILRALVALSIVALAGCQEYVFEPAVPALVAVSNTTTSVSPVDKADILFVVDDSGSMLGEQQNLAANFDAFISAVEARNQARQAQGLPVVDYRIAVTTTAVSQRLNLGTETNPDIDFRDTYPQAASGCNSALGFAAEAPYPAGEFVAAPGNAAILDRAELSSQEIVDQFRENVQVGTCGSGQEQGLRAMRLALEKHPDFVRDNSVLVVAFISDEEDCSDSSADDGEIAIGFQFGPCVDAAGEPGAGPLDEVAEYVDFLRNAADDVAVGVVVSAKAQSNGQLVPDVCDEPTCAQTCDCQGIQSCLDDEFKHGNPCFCGGQTGGSRYLDLADALDGLEDSVCQSDFSSTLENLADRVVPVTCVDLTAAPYDDDPGLMLLEIEKGDSGDRVLCTSPAKNDTCESNTAIGWEYRPDESRICLCLENTGSDCRIEPGDTYTVSFVAQACSPESPCPQE